MVFPPAALAAPGAAAVLVATGRTSDPERFPSVPAARNSAKDLAQLLTDRCAMPPERITTVVDPPGPEDIIGAVRAGVSSSPDLLFLYFVGHADIGVDNELRLTTGRTGLQGAAAKYASLDFRDLLEEICSAAPRPRCLVAILDCCYSGRALSADLGPLRQSCLLVSAAHDEQALAPVGDRHTALTGGLIRLLQHGAAELSAELTLQDVASHLSRNLTPVPMMQSRGSAGLLVLARNAHPDAVEVSTAVRTQHGRDSGECPYPGLSPFDEHNARWFHGRARLTSRLAVSLTAPFGPPLPLMLVGASGSGKSSLI
ncbi:hypothetical protein ACI2LP_34300, partial [Streptomyces sp. NPDC019890]